MNLCNNIKFLAPLRLVLLGIDIIKIVVPIILVVICMITLFKSIFNEEKESNEAFKKVSGKLILAVSVYLVPTIITLTISIISDTTNNYNCIKNATSSYISFNAFSQVNKIINDTNFTNSIYELETLKNYIYDDELKNSANEIIQDYKSKMPELKSEETYEVDCHTYYDVSFCDSDLKQYDISIRGLSSERKAFVRVAMGALGKIPYYYGGDATNPGFEGNNFGGTPQKTNGKKNQEFIGLDCAAYIDWAAWTAYGDNLGFVNTTGLRTSKRTTLLFTKDSNYDLDKLLPGDIVFNKSYSHVGIYLGNGYYIHEMSYPYYNVVIENMEGGSMNWTSFYRLNSLMITD